MSKPEWCPACLKGESSLETIKVRYNPATGEILKKPGMLDSSAKKEAYEKASEGNGWHCSACDYKWMAVDYATDHSPLVQQTALPDLQWGGHFLKAQPAPQPSGQPIKDQTQLLEWLANGTELQMLPAYKKLLECRPRDAVPALLQIAAGKSTKLAERQMAATFILCAIGDSAAIKGLVDNPPYFENSTALLSAYLGEVGNPIALPYLRKIAASDTSFDGFKAQTYLNRAYALMAQARIGHPNAFLGLVEDAQGEFRSQIYTQSTNNAMMRDKSMGWRLVGLAAKAMDMRSNSKWATRNASLMTSPDVTLSAVVDAPPDVRRMWLLHLRLDVIDSLVAICGKESLIACWSKAKDSIQKLMIALPMLNLEPANKQWQSCLTESTRSKHMNERLLVYEKAVHMTIKSTEPIYHELATAGFKDKDSDVQSAVAAATVYCHATGLVPSVLELAQSKSSDMRIAMAYPIIDLAEAKDPRGISALEALKQDRDKNVREAVAALLTRYTKPARE